GVRVGRPGFRVLAVPLDGPPQAFLEVDRRLPAEYIADLRGIDVLAIDLALGVPRAADVGLDARARELRDQLDDVADPVRAPATGVERLAAHVVAVQVVGDRQV